MKQINYILINETSNKNADRAISNSKLPGIGHHVICDAGSKFQISSTSEVAEPITGSSARQRLIEELVRLRKQHPDAKILGISELGKYCVHPSEKMNYLRRELSDLP